MTTLGDLLFIVNEVEQRGVFSEWFSAADIEAYNGVKNHLYEILQTYNVAEVNFFNLDKNTEKFVRLLFIATFPGEAMHTLTDALRLVEIFNDDPELEHFKMAFVFELHKIVVWDRQADDLYRKLFPFKSMFRPNGTQSSSSSSPSIL